jgi:hypothetical protein
MRLLEQQGESINPEDFSPAPQGVKSKGSDDADDDEFENDEDYEDEDSELAEELSFIVVLDENVLWVATHMREKAEYALGRKAVEWHELPQPIEKRPRPHP